MTLKIYLSLGVCFVWLCEHLPTKVAFVSGFALFGHWKDLVLWYVQAIGHPGIALYSLFVFLIESFIRFWWRWLFSCWLGQRKQVAVARQIVIWFRGRLKLAGSYYISIHLCQLFTLVSAYDAKSIVNHRWPFLREHILTWCWRFLFIWKFLYWVTILQVLNSLHLINESGFIIQEPHGILDPSRLSLVHSQDFLHGGLPWDI